MNALTSVSGMHLSERISGDDRHADVKAAAKDFETLLWTEMLNSMHRTTQCLKSGDSALSPDRGWADDWLTGIWARSMTEHGQSGLADAMLRQLRIEP